ncbi:cysteine hydrolase family protein [Pseudomonas abieticivorans]|uniref:cysteine hydrolase family protein n=1 Tax=Pseudomonas abieticivorans TaxID=2931382 RepID=UPI0020BEAC85|nr:cysteine hydrolase family protein [Pseudomonas sp. PIA16]
MSTALLIIDVQVGLCTGADAAFEIDRVIANLNQVSTQARSVGAPVVLIQHEEPSGTLKVDSPGWQLAHGLHTAPNDVRIHKTTPDSFLRTSLLAQLQAKGITRLVIGGLQSEFCVDSTTRMALALGFDVVLLADGHSTVDNGVLTAAQISAHHTMTLGNLSSFGKRALVVAANDVVIA